MSIEFTSYFLAVLIVAMLIGGLIYLLFRRERSRGIDYLPRMKNEFFPQLESNLLEISKKLHGNEESGYTDLVTRDLSSTLMLEFDQRFEDKSYRLTKLRTRLKGFELELAKVALKPKDSSLTEEAKLAKIELQSTLDKLIMEVQELRKLDRLPRRLPHVGHEGESESAFD